MQINLLYLQSFTDSTFVTSLKSGEKAQLGFVLLNIHPIFDSNFQRGFSIDILTQRIKTFPADNRKLQNCQALFPHWTEQTQGALFLSWLEITFAGLKLLYLLLRWKRYVLFKFIPQSFISSQHTSSKDVKSYQGHTLKKRSFPQLRLKSVFLFCKHFNMQVFEITKGKITLTDSMLSPSSSNKQSSGVCHSSSAQTSFSCLFHFPLDGKVRTDSLDEPLFHSVQPEQNLYTTNPCK